MRWRLLLLAGLVPALTGFTWCEPIFKPDVSGYMKVVVGATVIIRSTCDGSSLVTPAPVTNSAGEACVDVGPGEDITTSDAYVFEIHPLNGPGFSEIRWIGVPTCP